MGVEGERPEPEARQHTFEIHPETDEPRCLVCGAGIEMAEIGCIGRVETGSRVTVRRREDMMTSDYRRFLEGEITSEDYARRLVKGVKRSAVPESETDPDWQIS